MLDQLFAGIALGGVYALIALGYTMVYGIIGFINFAHGEVMMLGVFYLLAFTTPLDPSSSLALGLFTAATTFFATESRIRVAPALLLAAVVGHAVKIASIAVMPIWIAFPSALFCAGILGAALERVAYRPLRNAPRLAPLISAIGASLFFQNLAQIIFGTYRLSLPAAITIGELRFGGIAFSNVLIIVTAFATMIALHFFITRTRTGTAMRATSQDRKAAALMGINVDGIIATTFVVGAVLAALGGFLFTVYQKNLWPYMGFMIGIKAFTAAVLGGIGNIPGAMLGGFLLGIIETFGAALLPEAGYKDAISFIILIGVLLFRPSGILGKPTVVKV